MKQYLTPGPAALYFTVDNHIKQALKEQLLSESHRSKKFIKYVEKATMNLRMMLDLPEGYHVLFVSSATEVMEQMTRSCVDKKSVHFVNGAFSQRYHKFALSLGKEAKEIACQWGSFPNMHDFDPGDAELIAITQNETSTGVAVPVARIHELRERFPDPLITVDMVSSAPYPKLDFSKVDSVFFSVQKSMGLPAGLGVWIVNERCLDKARKLKSEGKILGAHHNILDLYEKSLIFQTTETPNMLGIYLLAQVTEDMLYRGIGRIRQETDYKAAVLYQMLENHPFLKPFVNDSSLRSNTVIIGESDRAPEVLQHLDSLGFVLGSGYGKYKNMHVRIANFPATSKEVVERVADEIAAMK